MEKDTVVQCPTCFESCTLAEAVLNSAFGRFVASVVDNKPIPATKPPCPIHPNQELVFWDMDHRRAVCAFCLLLGPAKGHRHCTLQEALKMWRREIGSFLDDAAGQDAWFAKSEADARESAGQLEEAARGVQDGICRSIDSLIRLLETRKRDLLADVDLVVGRARQAVSGTESALASQHQKLRNTASAAFGMFQTCTLEELLSVRHVLDNRWRSVLAQQEKLHETLDRALDAGRKCSHLAFDSSAIELGIASQIEAFGRIVNPILDDETASVASAFSASGASTQMQSAILDAQIDAYEPVFTLRPHDALFQASEDSPYLWPVAVCGPFLCVGDSAGTLFIFNANTLAQTAILQGHTSTVCSIVSVESLVPPRRITSGSYDGTIRIWDLDSSTCISTIQAYPNIAPAPTNAPAPAGSQPPADTPHPVWSLAYVEGSRRLVAGTSDGIVRFYDVSVPDPSGATMPGQIGAYLGEFRASPSPSARILSLSVSLDERYLYCGTSDFCIAAFDLLRGVEVTRAQTSAEVWSLCSAPTGELYAGVSGGAIEVWQWTTLQPSSGTDEPIRRLSRGTTLTGHTDTARGILCVGPRHVWSCGVDGRIIVWWRWAILQRAAQVGRDDIQPIVRVIDDAHASFSYGLAKSGARVFSSSDDGSVRVWDPAVPSFPAE